MTVGRMILSFFEKRTTQAFFGLVQNEEKVVFEQWVIPILVDINPSPPGHDHASGREVHVFDGGYYQ